MGDKKDHGKKRKRKIRLANRTKMWRRRRAIKTDIP